MKNIIIRVCVVLFTVLFIWAYCANLKQENERLKSNQNILLQENEFISAENQFYKVSDSLNAAKVTALQLTLSEYKKYKANDLQLIKQLSLSKQDLQAIISTQVKTINTISARLQDTILADTIVCSGDEYKCFNYISKWIDVEGCIDLNADTIDLQIYNREAIKIIETVKYKRFLGFLWKTNKIKSRKLDIISENPNTSIINTEYITISR